MSSTPHPTPQARFPVILKRTLSLVNATARGYTAAMDEHGEALMRMPADARRALRETMTEDLNVMARLRDGCAIMKYVAIRVLATYGVTDAAGSKDPGEPKPRTAGDLADEINAFATIMDSAFTGQTLNAHANLSGAQLAEVQATTQADAEQFAKLKEAAATLVAVMARIRTVYKFTPYQDDR